MFFQLKCGRMSSGKFKKNEIEYVFVDLDPD
jgi:hypothetical protein